MSARYLLLGQLSYLKKQGHQVSVVCGKGPWIQDVIGAGIPVQAAPLTRQVTPLTDLRAFVVLLAHFVRLHPDLVHTHTPKASLIGQWAAFAAGVRRRVHTIHGLYFPAHMQAQQRWRYLWLERIQMRPAHLVLSQNREDMETCRRDSICSTSRLYYLGNGIDITRYHPRNVDQATLDRYRHELGIPRSSCVVGMVGRLVREKGYLEYFDAALLVLRKFPSTTFLAIGSSEGWKPDAVGPEDATARGLTGEMRFLGHRDDMPALYALMDVLVLPSHREGMPRAPMEAAATGRPVVASNVRGCREVVINGETGLLVAPRDAAALANGIVTLLADHSLRVRLGLRGRQVAEEQFDERLVFERLARAYSRLDEGPIG